jgi:DNA-directed RNA polymerase sigma subunit (sigma70/sigma32)
MIMESKTKNIKSNFPTNDMTLQEVADYMCISRERVRQIELQALKKIRHPKHSKFLRDYLDL